jgi:hypothetical protein
MLVRFINSQIAPSAIVFNDANGNGLQDNGEAGINGVTVALYDPNGKVVGSTTTNSTGNYGFDVAPGSYSIKVTLPSDYVATVKDANGNASDAADSDIEATGKSSLFFVGSGQTNNTIDAGLVRSARPRSATRYGRTPIPMACRTTAKPALPTSASAYVRCQWRRPGHPGHQCQRQLPVQQPGGGHLQRQVHRTVGLPVQRQDTGSNDAVDSDVTVVTGKTGKHAGRRASRT